MVCVDGLASYVTAFRRVFRHAVRTGRPGRPRLVEAPGLLIGQGVKRYAQRRVISVVHRLQRGTTEAIAAALAVTGGGTVINTAYSERLNATFRSALAPLVRRGRALAHTEEVLTAGMSLVGCAYNFCWYHRSLRLRATTGGAAEVAGADAGDSSGLDRSLLDHAGATELPGASTGLGSTQAPGASSQTEAPTGDGRGGLMTLLHAGAHPPRAQRVVGCRAEFYGN